MIKLFKALGDENRLRILNLLMYDELCVCEIEVLLEMTQSNVSRHLSKLKDVNLISSSKDAQWVHYKLNSKFEEKNQLIIEFLKERFKIDPLYENDTNRYLKYKENNLNCQFITEDKEKVLNMIK
ncbi:ArsR/SmtB family transcription factor [Anaeromicrobium sediminis]|uniref:Transcriptional regulator n=1 Tax=Anaeromicrobium sediminis TaxID=1478221 RepID=A0A267MG52_9FIRM|nr:metalloregulator ArsR/SmtB family transcription factor [Anaeromicrobium sediminis]PAB57888.1 transcriptional regulator [Anaeromicrobium sediminis]